MVPCDVAPIMATREIRDQSSMLGPAYIIRPSRWSVGVEGITEFWGLSRLFFRARRLAPLPANFWINVVMPQENLKTIVKSQFRSIRSGLIIYLMQMN